MGLLPSGPRHLPVLSSAFGRAWNHRGNDWAMPFPCGLDTADKQKATKNINLKGSRWRDTPKKVFYFIFIIVAVIVAVI